MYILLFKTLPVSSQGGANFKLTLTSDQMNLIMILYDADGNGEISMDEAIRRKQDMIRATEDFEKVDTNGDMMITREELNEVGLFSLKWEYFSVLCQCKNL